MNLIMIKIKYFLIFNLIGILNSQLNEICSNFDSININYLSTNNKLIAYYKQSYNLTFNKLIYQQISDLVFNKNLNPLNLNKNYKEGYFLIKKGLKSKIYLYLNDVKILTYKNSTENCLKKDNFLDQENIKCLVKYYDHCWFGNLSSNLIKHDSYVCLNQKETFYFNKTLNKTQVSANFFKDKVKGIALVDIKELKFNNWLIFKKTINSLYKFDDDWKIKNLPYNNIYQPNKIIFGCPQPFCLKATFDDLIYDSFKKQLIIYRGQFYFKINISEKNLKKKKFSIDQHYLKPNFAKSISKLNQNDSNNLYYSDAIEIISNSLKTYRIHIKNNLVFVYNHKTNVFLFKKNLKKIFPKIKAKYVNSMFYKNNILSIITGNKIYSYIFNWKKEKFIISKQNFYFKLPLNIESSFVYNNQIYFFKENYFYISSKRNHTLGPIKIFDNFLINCNQTKYKFFNLEEEYVLSADNFTENETFFNNFTNNLLNLSIIGIIIVLSIASLVVIFAFFELLTPKRKSCYQDSLKNKGKGLILRPITSSSENDKEFVGLIMKNQMRFSKNSETVTVENTVE